MGYLDPLTSQLLVKPGLHPALSDDAAVNGPSADTAGYDRALVVLSVGATDITFDAKVQDSADDSTFADVTNAAFTQVAADGDDSVFLMDLSLIGVDRYIRVVGTAGNGTLGVNRSAVIVLGKGKHSSPTQDETVISV